MSTALTPAQKKQSVMRNTLRDLLEKGRERFGASLPTHSPLTAQRMINVALTACTVQPKLFECSMESIAQAMLVASQTGLEPDGYHAHLVPYKTRCTFIPDYKGLIQLALDSNVIIDAYAVREKDQFSYALGTNPHIEHVPSEEEDRGELKFAYAVARFPSGLTKFVVATRSDVMKRKRVSQARNADAPWQTWEEEMWIKTSVKMLAKFIPRSRRLDAAIRHDNSADAGMEQTPLVLDHIASSKDVDAVERIEHSKTEQVLEAVQDRPAFTKSEYATALLQAKDTDQAQEVFDNWVEYQAAELSQELYRECVELRNQRLFQLEGGGN